MVTGRRYFSFQLGLAGSGKASAVTDPPRPDWPRGDACGTPGINAATTNANDRLLMSGDFTVALNIGSRGETSIRKA